MPIVLPIPTGSNLTITFYVNCRIAVLTRQSIDGSSAYTSMFNTPSFVDRVRLWNCVHLTDAEYNSIDWSLAVYSFAVNNDMIACTFRRAMALSAQAQSVNRIYMSSFNSTAATCVIQARLRQSVALKLHHQTVERYTATAMALHARVGGASGMGTLGRDLVAKIKAMH